MEPRSVSVVDEREKWNLFNDGIGVLGAMRLNPVLLVSFMREKWKLFNDGIGFWDQ